MKSEGLHYLNDCLRKCDCGMGRAGRILGPTKLRVLLKAEIWQLLLERRKVSRRSVDEAGILGEASGRPELRVSPH